MNPSGSHTTSVAPSVLPAHLPAIGIGEQVVSSAAALSPGAFWNPSSQSTHACIKTRWSARHMVGSQYVSPLLASSPAALVIPAAHAAQVWFLTKRLDGHLVAVQQLVAFMPGVTGAAATNSIPSAHLELSNALQYTTQSPSPSLQVAVSPCTAAQVSPCPDCATTTL